VLWGDINVSEVNAASIFRVKWYPTTTLHGVTTQKTWTAVKTLKLTYFNND
jgi:hypothetical protein